MTDLEKLEARLDALNDAIVATKKAAALDRKLSHDKHGSGHYTKALDELTRVQTGLQSLIIRVQAVGR